MITSHLIRIKRMVEMARLGKPAMTLTTLETVTTKKVSLHLEEADVVKEVRIADSAMVVLEAVAEAAEDKTRRMRSSRVIMMMMTRLVITKTRHLVLRDTQCLAAEAVFLPATKAKMDAMMNMKTVVAEEAVENPFIETTMKIQICEVRSIFS